MTDLSVDEEIIDILSHTLTVNLKDSRCENCLRGTSPFDTHHTTVLGWQEGGEPGCGTEFKYIRSDYFGCHMQEWADRNRPDLEWVGFDEKEWIKQIGNQ